MPGGSRRRPGAVACKPQNATVSNWNGPFPLSESRRLSVASGHSNLIRGRHSIDLLNNYGLKPHFLPGQVET
jgi:hypothetical protein